MENPTPQQVLVALVNEFTICINILLENKHTLPALVLMYSAIDVSQLCYGRKLSSIRAEFTSRSGRRITC